MASSLSKLAPQVECKTSNLFIMVMSGVANFRDRQLIRRTWGSHEQLELVNATLIFVIGDFKDSALQVIIEQESER